MPSRAPTATPTSAPSRAPTISQTPTATPTTAVPTSEPSAAPSAAPTEYIDVPARANDTFFVSVSGDVEAAPIEMRSEWGDQPHSLFFSAATNDSIAELYVRPMSVTNLTALSRTGCGLPNASRIAAAFRVNRSTPRAYVRVSLRGSVYRTLDRELVFCQPATQLKWLLVNIRCPAGYRRPLLGDDEVGETVCSDGVFAVIEPWTADRYCRDGAYGCSCTRSALAMSDSTDAGGYLTLLVIGALMALVGHVGAEVLMQLRAPGDTVLRVRASRLAMALGAALMPLGCLFIGVAYIEVLPASERGPQAYGRCSGKTYTQTAWIATAVGTIVVAFLSAAQVRIWTKIQAAGYTSVSKSSNGSGGGKDGFYSRSTFIGLRVAAHVVGALAIVPLLATFYRSADTWWLPSLAVAFYTAVLGYLYFRRVLTKWAGGIYAYRLTAVAFTVADVITAAAVVGGAMTAWPCNQTYLISATCP